MGPIPVERATEPMELHVGAGQTVRRRLRVPEPTPEQVQQAAFAQAFDGAAPAFSTWSFVFQPARGELTVDEIVARTLRVPAVSKPDRG
jgi:hypothetical protein